MYIYVYIHTYVHTCIHITYIHTCTCMHTYVHVHTYIHVHACIRTYIQGVLLSNATMITEANQLKRLWTHEVFRVYYDRLVDNSDRAWLVDFLAQTMTSEFDTDFNELFKHLDFNEDGMYIQSSNYHVTQTD